ncbi:13103_t:CDS:2 [Ambispora gerdemannii]|uniref:13103_t:CDS:1 n=1 Tax=Ambispora gerdemannii TaxID=144530 RepID=A0A9N9B6E5_9GLOM|nr:13103_t:CDS:2 [Ambispora gerdemannii]
MALKIDPKHQKASMRKSKALYNLQQDDKPVKVFNDLFRIKANMSDSIRNSTSVNTYTNAHGCPRLGHTSYLSDTIELRRKRSSKIININYSTGVLNDSSLLALITAIVQKINEEPEICQEIYELYAGSDFTPINNLDKDSSKTDDNEVRSNLLNSHEMSSLYFKSN